MIDPACSHCGGEHRAHGLLERAIDAASVPDPQWLRRLFSAGGKTRLCIAKQNSRLSPSSASLRPLSLRSAVQVRPARRSSSP
jgi:hypothetical protein